MCIFASQELDTSDCTRLEALPEGFGSLVALTKLLIGHCTRLLNLPQTISGLTKLRNLDASGCRQLASLPEGISRLVSLSALALLECNSLRTVPLVGLSGMTSLRSLSVGGALFNILPGLDFLGGLDVLRLEKCPKLGWLATEINRISGLKCLSLSHWGGLVRLPDRLAGLLDLQVRDREKYG